MNESTIPRRNENYFVPFGVDYLDRISDVVFDILPLNVHKLLFILYMDCPNCSFADNEVGKKVSVPSNTVTDLPSLPYLAI